MTVEKFALLSEDEYKRYKDIIPLLDSADWWLRTPSHYLGDACGVNHCGYISNHYNVCNPDLGIRPALILNVDPSEPEFWCKREKLIGKKVTYGAFTWTILDAYSNQVCVLCDEIIAKHRFDKANNYWYRSELKTWLETEGLDIIEGRVKT